jgi:hypothetical protein
MKWCKLSGTLSIICCLLITGCDTRQVEPGTDFQPDPETARIEAELHLMNLSQEAKYHTLKFGEGNAFMKKENVPVHDLQIHERTFYICPTTNNPRLLLMGKIRVEVSRVKSDINTFDSSPNRVNEKSQNQEVYPQ